MKNKPAEDRVEKAVGELAAAIFALSRTDVKSAFHSAGAASQVFIAMRQDWIKTGRIKYEDL